MVSFPDATLRPVPRPGPNEARALGFVLPRRFGAASGWVRLVGSGLARVRLVPARTVGFVLSSLGDRAAGSFQGRFDAFCLLSPTLSHKGRGLGRGGRRIAKNLGIPLDRAVPWVRFDDAAEPSRCPGPPDRPGPPLGSSGNNCRLDPSDGFVLADIGPGFDLPPRRNEPISGRSRFNRAGNAPGRSAGLRSGICVRSSSGSRGRAPGCWAGARGGSGTGGGWPSGPGSRRSIPRRR